MQEKTKQEQLAGAVKTAANILSYADNTASQLRLKLAKRGYDDDVIEAAVGYMVEKGFLREGRQLVHAVEYMAGVKLFGRRRIYQELRRRGYSTETVENFAEGAMAEVDFDANCLRLARKSGIPADRAARDKLSRTLLRYGYDSGEIRRALDALEE